MTGEPTARTATADGEWVFTLYRNARKGPFVHALGARDGVAFCIDLPRSARSSDAAARAWGLALSPDEGTLYAANPVLGLVVEVGTDDHQVRRVARMPRSPALPAAAAPVVSPGGAALYVPSGRGVEVVDTTTLRPGRPLLAGTAVRGLAAAAGGRRLYAATAGGELVGLDARTGHVLARTRAPGAPVGVATR
jgi:DNA-binding beta-propeller fold protein YncE